MSTNNSKHISAAGIVVEPFIHELRGMKIVLDVDLALIYSVPVKRLNEQVKRNRDRFPSDFMFQISEDEARELENLRSQIATSSSTHGGRRYLPHAFTEHGAIMAATILNSPRAVEMSVFVVRAFIRMRETIGKHKEIDARHTQLEENAASHDSQIQDIIRALRKLMTPPVVKKNRMGFQLDE